MVSKPSLSSSNFRYISWLLLDTILFCWSVCLFLLLQQEAEVIQSQRLGNYSFMMYLNIQALLVVLLFRNFPGFSHIFIFVGEFCIICQLPPRATKIFWIGKAPILQTSGHLTPFNTEPSFLNFLFPFLQSSYDIPLILKFSSYKSPTFLISIYSQLLKKKKTSFKHILLDRWYTETLKN